MPEYTVKMVQQCKEREIRVSIVENVEEIPCRWHEIFDEQQTPEQRETMTCPRCDGVTEWVKFAIQEKQWNIIMFGELRSLCLSILVSHVN